jgi:hypothetical protein
MTGILLDVSGRRPKARGVLEKAFAVYEAAGYDHGIVQAAISASRCATGVPVPRTVRTRSHQGAANVHGQSVITGASKKSRFEIQVMTSTLLAIASATTRSK